MMYLLETVNLCLAVCLCIICTRSDIHKGIIYNKILVIFSVAAVIIDSIYYIFFAKDLLLDFLINFIVITTISLCLFYSYSFAGGDCKMAIVLTLLYPARCYLMYGSSIITLVFAIGFAIFAGYLYMLVNAIKAIITKKVTFNFKYIKNFLLNFSKSYTSTMIYIILLNYILMLCNRFGIYTTILELQCIYIFTAWCVGHYPIFKKMFLLIPTTVIMITTSVITHKFPISLNPETYVLVLILLLCQMTIKTTIYEKIRIEQLQKGMILTTLSSVLMQSSITKGLPGISTENLKSRLTIEEIESIKIWAKATHTEELTIVKKIPFAIFISIGFLSYFLLWRILI